VAQFVLCTAPQPGRSQFFIFEQYILVVFINNLKCKCMCGIQSNTNCYSFSSCAYYTLSDMFRPFYNGHLQASILADVNTIVTRNIRDLVSRAKLAIYYHILVGAIVVN
jgi:hypothetical protein